MSEGWELKPLKRQAPTGRPFAFPSPSIVSVADTNALAARACNAAMGGGEDLFSGLASTGRSPTFVSAHVPGELDEHLAAIAAKRRTLALVDVERALWDGVMSYVPVVDLAVRDYLHPRVRPMMRDNLDLPRQSRGDPDDIGTAALAEFLAPAVIISADSVFTRFGFANTMANTWLPNAHKLLRAAGFEADLTDTSFYLEVAGRILAKGALSPMPGLLRRHPVPVMAVVGAIAFVAWQQGLLSGEKIKTRVQMVKRSAIPLLNKASEAFTRYEDARGSLLVIEPFGIPTLEEATARYLARCGRPLTPAALADGLAMSEHELSAQEVEEVISGHLAFTAADGGAFTIGRRARSAEAVVQSRMSESD